MTRIRNLGLENADPLHSIRSASAYLGGCAEWSIRAWIREKKLPACRVMGRVFVRQSELDSFIKDGSSRSRPYRKRGRPKTKSRRRVQ